MQTFRGIAVSPGVAIGPGLVLDADGVRIPQRRVPAAEVETEIARLHTALAAAAFEATRTQRDITTRLGPSTGPSCATPSYEDPAFLGELDTLIRAERFAADYAVSRAVREFVKTIEDLGENNFLAWRAADLYDIESRILKHLVGDRREPLKHLREPVIVLARDLTPSETATLDRDKVFAFATEHGGRTSHTAIMANAMSIPAVVGIGHFLNEVASGDTVVVDGAEGALVIDPDPATLAIYKKARDARLIRSGYWVNERNLPSLTLDGAHVALFGNIEFPDEATACTARGPAASASSNGVPVRRRDTTRRKKSTSGPTCGSSRRWARAAGSSSDPGPRGRQVRWALGRGTGEEPVARPGQRLCRTIRAVPQQPGRSSGRVFGDVGSCSRWSPPRSCGVHCFSERGEETCGRPGWRSTPTSRSGR